MSLPSIRLRKNRVVWLGVLELLSEDFDDLAKLGRIYLPGLGSRDGWRLEPRTQTGGFSAQSGEFFEAFAEFFDGLQM